MSQYDDAEKRRAPTEEGLSSDASGSEAEDTEGHIMMVDPSAARELARARSADIDRGAQDRLRSKGAPPNRR